MNLLCSLFICNIFLIGVTYDKKSDEIAVNSAFKAEEHGIDWLIQCFADVPHLGKAIKNAFNNQSELYIDEKYLIPSDDNILPKYLKINYDNILPTNVVNIAAVRAVVEWDKGNELKLAPHLPREALDLGKYSY